MKKLNQYLPFILWSIATLILTLLSLIVLPVLILMKKAESFLRANTAKRVREEEEQTRADSVYVI